MARMGMPDWLGQARKRGERRGRHERALARRLDRPDRRLDFDVVGAGLLRAGDYILCVPGDVVPVDGTVVDGQGWTLPPGGAGATVLRDPYSSDEEVAAGDIVQSGWLVIRVAATAGMRRAG